MRNKFYLFLASFLVAAVALGVIGTVLASSESNDAPVRKIVVFEKKFVNKEAKDELVRRTGGVKVKDLDLIDGMAVYLPSRAAEEALLNQAGVLRVDDDVVVEILARNVEANRTVFQPLESLPWGIDRIDADLAWSTTTGDPVKVAVVDTGIYLNHPDLAQNIKGGYNAINPTKSANDDNGHGSHVSGIIGALDNEIGVIGVGPRIDLYAVKVLNRNGSGYLSDVIEGLDWAIQNKMQVVNMSLGTSSDIPSFRDAIQRVNVAGIIQVAAAGNNGGTVNYPAAYPEVIAVSAVDSNGQIPYWSSRGPEVDLTAPGVGIYSTWKGGGYYKASGTSMASPHVAGTAALVLTTSIITASGASYDLDGDGIWDPIEVKLKLQTTAEWLAGLTSGEQGAGLVDAEAAVAQ